MILFAKAPLPGRVKTRLASYIGAERAAQLHEAFVRDMLEMLGSLGDSADLALHTDIATDAWPEAGVARKLQYTGDLALKMLYAMRDALAEGRSKVVVVGSDAPTLPADHVRQLLACAADVALGPAEDGGYYAICCRRIHADMFGGVRWSSPNALVDSEAAARNCGLTVERGPAWYDIDEPEDLQRLLALPRLPRFTAEWRARFCIC